LYKNMTEQTTTPVTEPTPLDQPSEQPETVETAVDTSHIDVRHVYKQLEDAITEEHKEHEHKETQAEIDNSHIDSVKFLAKQLEHVIPLETPTEMDKSNHSETTPEMNSESTAHESISIGGGTIGAQEIKAEESKPESISIGGGTIGAQLRNRNKRSRAARKKQHERENIMNEANERITEAIDAMGIQSLVSDEENRQLNERDQTEQTSREIPIGMLKTVEQLEEERRRLAGLPSTTDEEKSQQLFSVPIKGAEKQGADVIQIGRQRAKGQKKRKEMDNVERVTGQIPADQPHIRIPIQTRNKKAAGTRKERQEGTSDQRQEQRKEAEQKDYEAPFRQVLVEIMGLGDESAKIPVTPRSKAKKTKERPPVRRKVQSVPEEEFQRATYIAPSTYQVFERTFEPITESMLQRGAPTSRQPEVMEFFIPYVEESQREPVRVPIQFSERRNPNAPKVRKAKKQKAKKQQQRQYTGPSSKVDWIEPGRQRELEERLEKIVAPDESLIGELVSGIGSYMSILRFSGSKVDTTTEKESSKKLKRKTSVKIPVRHADEPYSGRDLIRDVKRFVDDESSELMRVLGEEGELLESLGETFAPELAKEGGAWEQEQIMKDIRREVPKHRGKPKRMSKENYREQKRSGRSMEGAPMTFVVLSGAEA